MTEAEQMREVATNKGFDDLTTEERRARARTLLDRTDLSALESDELDVLLLMAVGLNETSARADLLLRKTQERWTKKTNRMR